MLDETECAGTGVVTCEVIDGCPAFGPPTECPSGEVCASGACAQPMSCAQDGATCDDADPCTTNDRCTAGVCTGMPACTTAPANGMATCGSDGTCGFVCNSGYVTAGSACVATGSADKQVFMTSQLWTGNLGNLDGADAKCQAAAAAANLTGTFKAWLSSSTSSAAARLAESTGDYKLVDGEVVAAGWTQLTSGQLAHAIDLDEHGQSVVSFAWTGTVATGASNADACTDWTVSDPGTNGIEGNSDELDAGWTDFSAMMCSESNALYCIEQ